MIFFSSQLDSINWPRGDRVSGLQGLRASLTHWLNSGTLGLWDSGSLKSLGLIFYFSVNKLLDLRLIAGSLYPLFFLWLFYGKSGPVVRLHPSARIAEDCLAVDCHQPLQWMCGWSDPPQCGRCWSKGKWNALATESDLLAGKLMSPCKNERVLHDWLSSGKLAVLMPQVLAVLRRCRVYLTLWLPLDYPSHNVLRLVKRCGYWLPRTAWGSAMLVGANKHKTAFHGTQSSGSNLRARA